MESDHKKHNFTGYYEDYTQNQNKSLGWSWHCSCGSHGHRDRYKDLSDAWGWYRHFFRAVGVTEPKSGVYEDWMYDLTREKFGKRVADVQKTWGTLVWPKVSKLPWSYKRKV